MKDELNLIISVLLGIIQGLTEFIPVSSTAHIRILPAFMNIADVGAAYTAVIQLGSLVALIIYFKKDLYKFTLESYIAIKKELSERKNVLKIIKDFEKWNHDARLPFYLILGTIPISIAGLLLKNLIKGPFRSLYIIAFSLIIFAIILWISDLKSKRNKDLKDLNIWDSLWIGFAQAFALIPGVSRSGVTLMAGLILNFKRESSMKFSFLLSIPAIALSGFYELIKDWNEIQQLGIISVIVGIITTVIVSYIAIAWLLKYLQTHNTLIFVVYRIFLGILIFILLYFDILQPY